jgi:gliding-associated putative ABC transporter substrate-binding component GldG
MVTDRPEQSAFKNTGNIPIAVLLEGQFHSVYENRVLPFNEKTFKSIGKNNKMIVVSDGDIIRNQLDKNFQPLELGYDKWTNKLYGNKEFMMNCVNYLLDDNGLINIRSAKPLTCLCSIKKKYMQLYPITSHNCRTSNCHFRNFWIRLHLYSKKKIR